MCVIYGTIRLAGQPFIYIPLFQKKKVKLIYKSLVIEGFETTLQDLGSISAALFGGRSPGSFPEQRLVIEPTQELSEKYLWWVSVLVKHSVTIDTAKLVNYYI